MRRAFDIATSAAIKGNHPFGAVLIHGGEVVLTAENTVNTRDNQTRHAKLNLVADGRRNYPVTASTSELSTRAPPPAPFALTPYRSACITRIVYEVTNETSAKLITKGALDVTIEEIYRQLNTPTEIIGGIPKEEWTNAYRHWPEKKGFLELGLGAGDLGKDLVRRLSLELYGEEVAGSPQLELRDLTELLDLTLARLLR